MPVFPAALEDTAISLVMTASSEARWVSPESLQKGHIVDSHEDLEVGGPGSEPELSLFWGQLEASGLQGFCTHRRWGDGGPGDILHFLHSLQE